MAYSPMRERVFMGELPDKVVYMNIIEEESSRANCVIICVAHRCWTIP